MPSYHARSSQLIRRVTVEVTTLADSLMTVPGSVLLISCRGTIDCRVLRFNTMVDWYPAVCCFGGACIFPHLAWGWLFFFSYINFHLYLRVSGLDAPLFVLLGVSV